MGIVMRGNECCLLLVPEVLPLLVVVVAAVSVPIVPALLPY